MSRISQPSDRRNHHLNRPSEADRARAPLVHLFPQNQQAPLFLALQQELQTQSFEYRLHTDLNELRPIVEAPLRKVFVVMFPEGGDDPLPGNLKAGSSSMLRMCSLGGQGLGSSDRPNFQTAQEVVRAVREFAVEEAATIRLSSVHSIRLSKDRKVGSSRELRQVATDSAYQKAFYFKNYRGEYMPEEDAVYENLVEELEREAGVEPFKSARELEKKEAPKGKKKYLVIASTNEASIKLILELRKAKLRYFHYLLLGRLNPCEQFLDDEVLLASNDPRAHVDFLLQNGFRRPGLQAIADRLANQRKQPPVAQVQSSRIVADLPSRIVGLESPKGHEEEPEKKKIRKIKSPNKGRPSQIQPESEPSLSNVNVNIVVSKHKDEPIIENDDFRTNKQGERIYKKESVKEVEKDPQLANQPGSNYFDARVESNMPSRYDAVAPAIENQFAAKKTSNIEAKYRNPSVIIQEMSDEYRGSNKESIMNLEPEKPNNKPEQAVNEPLQENSGKRIVSKGITYAYQPDTHYISSNQTIEYSRTNPAISDPNINLNANTIESTANAAKYISPGSPRVIAGSPITISTVSSGNVNSVSAGTRVYGRADGGTYQSPSRVIRKEVTVPEEIVQDSKSKQENRITFGSSFTNPNNNTITSSNPVNNTLNYSSNTLNYSNTNGNISIGSSYNYRNIQPAATTTTTSSYYTPQTFNYHTLHNEPYNSKIHVSPGRVEQVITSKVEEAKPQVANQLSLPKVEEKGTKQFIFNSEEYEQIERDGRIVYRKKVPIEGIKYTPINYVSPKIDKEEDGSPAVQRYQVSPIRREPPQITTYDYRTKTSQPTTTYDYTRTGNYSPRNYEVITVPYKADDHNLGEMIESSHKKKAADARPNFTQQKNFETVSYRNEDRSGVSNSYRETGVRVYGVNHPRVEVERVEQQQPKVQSASPKPVITPLKPKPQPAKGKSKQQLKAELTPKNALNESNWFSRMSQLHSDGSILRRNNIRFGVKLQKREQKVEGNSVVENKLVSGIYKVNDLNKKMALNRIIQGEEYIQEEKEKYMHINPSLNRFHLLLQEDLDYLHPTLTKYLAHPQDRIDSFAGVNSLFAILNTHSDAYDLGFVFARMEEMAHINPSLLPENYYLVSIEGEEGLLEINEGQRRVRVDQLQHFPLVQRIILDSQLYQYVAYRNSRPEVELLADKFINSEFILEKIETEFTTEILDCYYYELPRLTRLYVLCDESELPQLLAVVQAYSELNPTFKVQTCKLVCVLSNILGNDELIMAHPSVTFISNPEQITHYRHILGYAHHYDAPDPTFLPIDHLFYHAKHVGLEQQLTAHYPGRFAAIPFVKVAEVYGKVEKINKISAKHGHQPKLYLVLHESVNAEKVRVEHFTKIFMLGKAKVVQNKVVRVMNVEELLELLRK